MQARGPSLPRRAAGRRLASLLLCWVAGASLAQPASEAALKARLTLSLCRFAHWPDAAASAPLRVCVAQRSAEVKHAFDASDGQLVGGRRVEVQPSTPPNGCDVLYVHASAERPGELLKALGNAPVLTIGDGEGFIGKGGMVELVNVNDSVKFDVNLSALGQARLGLSSQVLKLARQVSEP